ncbi:hypothetical protein K501DRAFT_328309 [Backusella circina FSU 941]|nr:hypothetical protein K501DRAFT_328309 [Backusella circina FSU 941]
MQASVNDSDCYVQTIPYVLTQQDEDNITIDMINLYEALLPNKESHDRRTKFVKKIERLLNNEWPDHGIKAHVFGSSVNNLGTTSSDVDLCITTPWNGLRNVRTLAKLFRKCGMQHVTCVPRAKVPIVRLFDPELQLSCDINVNNTLALQNTKMVKTYVALDPRVRPLIMIIKHWTKQRLLNDAANGGTLSSYTWTCMIINFLQTRNPPILPVLHAVDGDKGEDHFCDNIERLRGFGSDNQETLGGLLYAFFRRFAIEFDYNQQVISVRQGRCLPKREKGWDIGRYKSSLCVEEPFNVTRNLGNSADQASVQGLCMEFHRFLDLLLNKADFDQLFTPFQPLFVPEPLFHKDVLSLTLPSENRTGYLPSHPYDRRRSMVDGIYTYPPSLFSEHHITHRSKDPFSNFHPHFSSPQALDTILKIRNTRHGSHPLISVPNLLLGNKSVDNIFARYQKKPRHKRQFKRQSSQEWPSISSKPSKEPIVINQQPLRRRRWSTTADTVKPEPEIPKKTLAEIVKIGTVSKPPIKMTKPVTEKTRRRHRNKSQNKQKKKSVKK